MQSVGWINGRHSRRSRTPTSPSRMGSRWSAARPCPIDRRLPHLRHAERRAPQRGAGLPCADRGSVRRRDAIRSPARRAGGRWWWARAGRWTPTASSSSAPTCWAAAWAPPVRAARATDERCAVGPWGTDFPPVTIRDMVRAQKRLIEHLGITRLFAVIGGSMGGMQVLEWAALYPDAVFAALPIACAAYHSAQNIAFHEVGRQAIFADPDWHGGRYWERGTVPARGLAVARMCAHITYLSEQALTRKFGRRLQNAPKDPSEAITLFGDMFEVESYLHHQGSTFVQPLRCQFVSDDHPRDGLFRSGGRLRRRSRQRLPRHADAVPAGRRSPPTGCSRPPRAAPIARALNRAGAKCQLRRDPDRQGPRRVPAGRAGFPSHAGRLPGRLRRACGAGAVGGPAATKEDGAQVWRLLALAQGQPFSIGFKSRRIRGREDSVPS